MSGVLSSQDCFCSWAKKRRRGWIVHKPERNWIVWNRTRSSNYNRNERCNVKGQWCCLWRLLTHAKLMFTGIIALSVGWGAVLVTVARIG